MKKSTMRVLSLVMAIMMIVGTLAVVPFSALPGNDQQAEEEHVHLKGAVVKTVDPTCTLYGYTVYTCQTCGEEFVTDITDKTGHDYQEVGEIPADCATETDGCTAGVKCVNCGDIKAGCFTIEAKHGLAYRIVDTADCTEGVKYEMYCPNCEKIIDDNVNTIVFAEDDHDLIATPDPDEPPTCEEGGYLIISCTNEGAYYFGDCIGDSYFDDCAYVGPQRVWIDALGHDWVEQWDEYGEPFEHYYQCKRCGAIEEIVVPVTEDHDWVPNGFAFSKDGVTYISSKQYDTADAFMTAYAHYSDVAPLYEIFACRICNETRMVKRVEKLGHIYGGYTFKFIGEVIFKDGFHLYTEEEPFIINLNGRIEVTYACEDFVTIKEYCEACYLRAKEAAEDAGIDNYDIEQYEADALLEGEDRVDYFQYEYDGFSKFVSKTKTAHKYSNYWICQNEECKDIDPETQEEIRPTIDVTVGGIFFDINNNKVVLENKTFTCELPAGYYHCKDCTHEQARTVCLNPVGTYTFGYNNTVTIIAKDDRDTVPEPYPVADEADEIHKALFDVIIEKDTVPTYNQGTIALCMKHPDFVVGIHKFGPEIEVPGTCIAVGYKHRVCSVCGYDERLEDTTLGDHDLEWAVAEPATCISDGVLEQRCTICGAVFDTKVIPMIEDEAALKNRTAHAGPIKVVEIIKKETCTADGERRLKCEACGFEWIEVVPMTNHVWDELEAKDPTCFDAGNKAYKRCSICGLFGTDEEGNELKGEIIPAFKHEGTIEVVELKAGDKMVTVEIEVSTTDEKFREKDFALRIRALDVEETAETYTYTIGIVPATCAKDGYVVGKYCKRCMDLEHNTTAEFTAEDNYTGYKIPKTENHHIVNIVSNPEELPVWEEVCGGKVYYAYDINYCTVCGYVFDDDDNIIGSEDFDSDDVYFDMLTAREHKHEYWELEDGLLEVAEYTVVNIGTDDEPIFIELIEDPEADNYNKDQYPNCTYATYTAKKCRLCEEFYDAELKTPAYGHYYYNDGNGNKLILTKCDKYEAKYVGVICSACGGKVPEYELIALEGEDEGLYREAYYASKDGSYIVPEDIGEALGHTEIPEELLGDLGYLLIEHEWIVELPCDKARIKECKVCGIKVVNELSDGTHKYLLRDGGEAAFDLDNFDDYAFDDVVYPTVTSEGIGQLTCVVCGTTLDVVIPALEAEISGEYDNADEIVRYEESNEVVKNVLVGDEVTVTLKITAKNFTFSELTFDVRNSANRVELVRAEILYPFDDVNDVKWDIDNNGNLTLRCINRNGNAVVSEAYNEDFVRLTFKTGDLTDAAEVTTYEANRPGIRSITATRVNENFEIVNTARIGRENADHFGTLNVYNPNYTYSPINVLQEVYGDGDAAYYDFNKDGRVDLVDYFAMVDYNNSAKSIADFCELVGYDVEAMLENVDYSQYSSGLSGNFTPGTFSFTRGTAEDIAAGKVLIKEAMANTRYGAAIIRAGVTIQEFAQSIIDAKVIL